MENSVLIVDDERTNIIALTHILGSDFEIYAAKNGQDAIETAKIHLPDVILLDIMMPEMNGYEVLARLKSAEETKSIPVIFVTGLTAAEDEEKGLSMGAADYITKPFSPAIVKLRIQNQIQLINQLKMREEQLEQQAQMEIARESSRAKSEFLARMSHEMHTPMNVIISMTSVAKNSIGPEKIDSCLDKIDSASRQLLRLIDDMLDISSLEESTLNFEHSEFSFKEMLTETLNAVKLYTNEKSQTLTHSIDSLIPAKLIGDRKRLAQVIRNILMNATKFTPKYGKIEINAGLPDLPGDENDPAGSGFVILKIEIIDNGIGISKEEQDSIFAPFEQADGGFARKFDGAGLGLAISRQIIERMGGKIYVESEPGKGSKFIFTVKVDCVDGAKKLRKIFDDKTALLVDDMATNRYVIMDLLESTQINIECAEDGLEAVRLFKENPKKYHIIFMDISMPVMDGWEAARRIRALDIPEAAEVKIVAVTALSRQDDIKKCHEAGMDDHIGKPIDLNDLIVKLNKYLG
jgi:signal transduction histidine kinase